MKSFQSTSIESPCEEEAFETNGKKLDKIGQEQKSYFSDLKSELHFEDINLEEIYDFISDLNKKVSLDSNTIFQKDKKIFVSNDTIKLNNLFVSEELLHLFNRKRAFKSFKSPQKVSLIGKVFINGKN